MTGGKFSRDKGARGERDVCAKLERELGIKFARNLKQYQEQQHGDIEPPCGPYLLEIKNCVSITLPPWWRQACAAADKRKLLPCLVFKERSKWRFMVPSREAIATGQQWRNDLDFTDTQFLRGFCLRVREQG
jgi:hypothetical protein